MSDGIINVGCAPESWGFTPDNWLDCSYLWRLSDRVLCSFLWAVRPGTGAFRRLVDAVEADGLKVAVPCPLGNFPEKLAHMGFARGHEWDEEMGEHVEVWMKTAPPALPLDDGGFDAEDGNE